MNFLLTTVTILAANLAMAAPPTVTCELTYSLSSDQSMPSMESSIFKAVIYETVKVQIKEFELAITLEPICAADGPCSGKYEVNSTLSTKDISTFASNEMKPGDQHFTQLSVGNEDAYANCFAE